MQEAMQEVIPEYRASSNSRALLAVIQKGKKKDIFISMFKRLHLS